MGSEPAFPNKNIGPITNGMTRRELFAAMAMQSVAIGVIANADGFEEKPTMALENLAMVAVAAADALIAELEKGGKRE